MKTLLVLRHAKSSWKDPELVDHDRPLNKRGKRDAPRIGELLREQGLTPDLILSSSAKRARKTARAVAESSGYPGEIESTRDLYFAEVETFYAALHAVPDEHERVLVVGHNPDVEELLAALTGENERMPTAALAQVSLPIERWRDLNTDTDGELVDLWRPRELD